MSYKLKYNKGLVSMKKVALYMPTAADGGVQRVIINLAKGLLREGDKVDIVLSKSSGNMLEQFHKECNIINLKQTSGKGDLLPILSLFKIIKYLKKNKPDVLIGCPGFSTIVCILATMLSFSNNKVIAMVDNKVSLLKGGRWYHKFTLLMMKVFYRFADYVVVAHKSAEVDIIKNLKLNRDKVKMIYHPLIEENIYNNLISLPNHPWMNNEEKIILGIGRLVKEKDFANLINAYKIVSEKVPSKLIIIGEGPERDKLQGLIDELKLGDSVSLPGYVSNPYQYISYSDLLVVSSRAEAFGNVIVEALAMGTPIVSTDCSSGGPAEILNNGEYGILCPCLDKDKLATSIIKSLNTKHDKEKIINRSKVFTVNRSVRLYKELIDG